MNQSEEIRDLFSRYAAAVGRCLPAKGRDDIVREIETTLADRLDDRMKPGQEPTVDDAAALLKETGHYMKTAASYMTHSALIGPSLYPLFLKVTRIVLSVLAAVLIGVLTLTAALKPDPSMGIAATAFKILSSTVTGLLQTFALLVIVFAVMERVDTGRTAAELEKSWDPRQLPRSKTMEAVKISDQIAAIVLSVVWVVFLVYLPRLVAVGSESLSPIAGSLALTPRLMDLLPFFMAEAGIQILAAIILLTWRGSPMAALGVQVAIKALNVIMAGLMLTAWPFFVTGQVSMEQAAMGFLVVQRVIQVGCWLGIIFGSIDVAATLLRHRKSTRASAA